ncbi:hypothetical protein D910_02571 [Dendroctonus ponderosae]
MLGNSAQLVDKWRFL